MVALKPAQLERESTELVRKRVKALSDLQPINSGNYFENDGTAMSRKSGCMDYMVF